MCEGSEWTGISCGWGALWTWKLLGFSSERPASHRLTRQSDPSSPSPACPHKLEKWSLSFSVSGPFSLLQQYPPHLPETFASSPSKSSQEEPEPLSVIKVCPSPHLAHCCFMKVSLKMF